MVAIALLLLPGCGAGDADDAAAGPPAADAALPPETDAMPDTSADSVRLRLEVPAQVHAGEPVPMALHIENTTDRTLTLHLVGRAIAFDVIVDAADGAVVWRRLEGEVVQSILRLDELPPGGEILLEDTWDQRSNAGNAVAPGEYRVRAEVFTEAEPLVSGTRTLRIAGG